MGCVTTKKKYDEEADAAGAGDADSVCVKQNKCV